MTDQVSPAATLALMVRPFRLAAASTSRRRAQADATARRKGLTKRRKYVVPHLTHTRLHSRPISAGFCLLEWGLIFAIIPKNKCDSWTRMPSMLTR